MKEGVQESWKSMPTTISIFFSLSIYPKHSPGVLAQVAGVKALFCDRVFLAFHPEVRLCDPESEPP